MKLDTSTDPQVGFRPSGSLDVASALLPYSERLSRRQAAHLLRRAAFGGTPAEVDALAGRDARAAVGGLLHPTQPDTQLPLYPDVTVLYDIKKRTPAAENWWLDRMLRTQHPLTEKMALFWHGHFATSIRKVPAALMVQQIDLLRSAGLGNFRTLLLSVSRDPAMLVWLDNRYNNRLHPNENYAREVMELFALGLGNYTEDDVKSAARAFTGWTLDKGLAFTYKDALHDDGVKTFLGRTGAFTGENVLDIIVEQPVHQRFICRKLLEYFLYSDPEPELIEALAQTYALSGYDVAHTVGTLLRSNVFFSTRAYRALPKSPIEFTIGLLRFMDVRAVPPDTIYWLRRMGQEPLAPPSVKGWDGGPTWINTATLLARFNYVNRVVGAAPLHAAFDPDAIVRRANGLDADRVLATVARDAVQDDLTGNVRATLMDYLQSKNAPLGMPLSMENYQEKIRGVLALTLNLPSNQLN
ncbi:MAG: DUF1800 domain-containing protein [Candidatus Eremiobacteraeota bacterium]|nr:DUF1800 domain-containing protein [Candidatus Eremiobacteraeota bacterium]